MKTFLIFLLLVQCSICKSQKVTFKVVTYNPCTNLAKPDSFGFCLYNANSSKYINYCGDFGIVELPSPGEYELYLNSNADSIFKIKIVDTGMFVFRNSENKLMLRHYGFGMHTIFRYEYCNERITGYKEDFYENGSLKIRGSFKDGLLKDSIVTFYPNGINKRRTKRISDRISFDEQYYFSGQLLSKEYFKYQKWHYVKTSSSQYFENGQRKLISTLKNNITRLKEYFENGMIKVSQGKTKRIEYDQYGSKRVAFEWKRKRNDENIKTVLVIKKEYDEKGNKTRKITYEIWDDTQQPDLDFTKADWIRKDYVYSKGKPQLRAHDVPAKGYTN